MNFSKMSGYEFEDFVANLLRQKGFKVTQTDYSNDGGVDLIAEFNQPFFSGKYIVQCKKYTDNLVGQPELRDLYGVVMSESANKGILITTSDFTTQARNFAKGKNLELINGKILNIIIEGENITVNEPELKFYEYPDFDKKNYEFLKKRLKAGKKNPQNYDNLTTMLESYILNANIEVCKAGLLDEIRNLREEKRINTNNDYVYNPNSNNIDLNELDLCFIEGNLLQATKTLIESEDFYFSNYPSFLSFYCCLNNIYYKNDIFFNMDFYKKDPLVKRIKTPNFLASYNKNVLEEIYKHLYIEIPEYFLDEGLDNWVNNISKIVDKNFSNIYSQEELKAIVEKYKHNEFSRNLYKYHGVQVSASISDWEKSDFNGYLNDLHKAKYIFMNKLRVDWKLSIKTPNLFRHLFLDKFNPFTILANSNTSKFTKLGNLISPLFGYPFKLMLYSAFKQIGFETGCVEMTKHIKIPKSINDFPFIELPEISKLLSPIFVKEYYKYVELEINSYNEFKNGALDNIFNPIWHDKYYKRAEEDIRSEIIINYFEKFLVAPGNIEMIMCEAGNFIMGSPENELGRNNDEIQHQVTISKPFMIGKYPVTQSQYLEIMRNNPSIFISYLNNPVENVTWYDAKNFCKKLNEKYKNYLPTGYQFDLPTEAQWEYACKAEKSTVLNRGKGLTLENNIFNLSENSWYDKNSNETTHKVGRKKPNAWGIYDMLGNIYEWCNDWYDDYSLEDDVDPKGVKVGEQRVLRGGSWDDAANCCRSAYRDCEDPNFKSNLIGFRVALVPIK